MSYGNKDATKDEDPQEPFFLSPGGWAWESEEVKKENAACDRKKLARRFLLMVWHEFLRADSRFPNFASAHEGYAVALEEMDEVWDAIKHNGLEEACREMIQVGAMSIRFLVDMEKHLKKSLPENAA